MMSAPTGSLLSLLDPSPEDWQATLALAAHLAGPAGRQPHLAGKRFGMLFFNPSLRTRTSFEVAAFDLGSHAVYLQVGGGLWTLEARDGVAMTGAAAEHVREAIPVLGRMVDGLGVRAFAGMEDAADDARDPVLRAIAAHSLVPVLNLESAMDHPHQGLADALTARRHLGGSRAKVAVVWAPHIKPLPRAVPHAAVAAFAREGHDVVLAHPEGYDLDGVRMDACAKAASAAGGSLRVTHDREDALQGARIVYAKSWGAHGFYGDADASAADLARHADWRLDAAALARTDDGRFMHCLPVRRDVVVGADVLDGPHSMVVDQAEARLHVQRATLCRALGVDPRTGEGAA